MLVSSQTLAFGAGSNSHSHRSVCPRGGVLQTIPTARGEKSGILLKSTFIPIYSYLDSINRSNCKLSDHTHNRRDKTSRRDYCLESTALPIRAGEKQDKRHTHCLAFAESRNRVGLKPISRNITEARDSACTSEQ